MNFLEAVKLSQETGELIRRPSWQDGVAMFVAKPSGIDDKRYKYSKEGLGQPYVATCHVAACELAGVRSLKDILAEDWELFYKKADKSVEEEADEFAKSLHKPKDI